LLPSSSPASPRTARLERVLLLCCLVAYLLAGLFGRGLWKADEPYSFGMVWNFLTTPDWLIPRVGTAPFMEKPPLMYWTGALAARLSSPWLSAPDGARLAVLAWMLVTLAALAWLVQRVLPGRRRQAVLALLGMLGIVQHSHLLIADVPQLAGATLGLAGLAAQLHDRRHPWRHGLLFGSGLGIAFMSKGLLVPGVLGLTGGLCAFCWPRRLVEPEGRRWLLAASLAALPWLLIWPLLLWHRAPELLHTWLWTNNIGRFFGLEARNSDSDGLVSSLADLVALSFPTGPILLGATLWQLHHRGLATVVLYTIVCLAVLLKSAVFRSLYLLPLFPALALLAARLQPPLPLARFGRVLGLGVWTPLIALLALGGLGLARGWPLPWPASIRDHLPIGERLPVSLLAWTLALLALVAWGLVLGVPSTDAGQCLVRRPDRQLEPGQQPLATLGRSGQQLCAALHRAASGTPAHGLPGQLWPGRVGTRHGACLYRLSAAGDIRPRPGALSSPDGPGRKTRSGGRARGLAGVLAGRPPRQSQGALSRLSDQPLVSARYPGRRSRT
jgi:4-amino-4-deoxy-L-arabinose transferase-like glycosyltransferase